jgi:hypothetical protein
MAPSFSAFQAATERPARFSPLFAGPLAQAERPFDIDLIALAERLAEPLSDFSEDGDRNPLRLLTLPTATLTRTHGLPAWLVLSSGSWPSRPMKAVSMFSCITSSTR